jgi:rep
VGFMKKEIIVYKNDMNTVPLRKFNPIELDLFFTIVGQMRDKGLSEVVYKFDELKELSNYNQTKGIERFIKDLESTYDKLISLNVKIGTSRKWTKFVFFTRYSIDMDNQIISIATNTEFEHLINKLTGNFTKLELEEFTELKSSYSKTAYRLLKQYRKTGYVVYEIDKFLELFCVPSSYKQYHINQRVLQPIKDELSVYFKNFKINKISKGKGRKITHIEFIFDSESDINVTGSGTFRDKNGFYYNKNLADFNNKEVHKKFKSAVDPMSERYDKNKLDEKEKMKQKWLEMFPEDVDIFK